MSAILSVGIDIGTSTTQVVFSRITMENTASYFSVPRISIVDKTILHRSTVHFTPMLQNTELLDSTGVQAIVAEEFQKAGYCPGDVDTGAVIITGASARKENAAELLRQLSSFAGDFVVSTAGPDLEAVIAGKGSGAWRYSVDRDCTVMNLDIGGGTTNIVLFASGKVQGKSCFDIGGRLIRLEADYTVRAVSPHAAAVAQAEGIQLRVGEKTTESELRRITDRMAELLAQAVGLAPAEPLLDRLHTVRSSLLGPWRPGCKICFSGGVAECIYRPDAEAPLRYGDIGILLGDSIRKNSCFAAQPVIKAGETIRATVVGAGSDTTELSGSTIDYDQGIFPMKNLPVLRLTSEEQAACVAGDETVLDRRTEWFLEQSDSTRLALAIPGIADPEYSELQAIAQSVLDVLDSRLPKDEPILVVTEQDMAKALGLVMRGLSSGRRKHAVIDGVQVEENDFLDLGHPLMDGLVVPVVVKTLIFG